MTVYNDSTRTSEFVSPSEARTNSPGSSVHSGGCYKGNTADNGWQHRMVRYTIELVQEAF